MFPYDGITRIRFLGYVLSPSNLASTPLASSLKAAAKVAYSLQRAKYM